MHLKYEKVISKLIQLILCRLRMSVLINWKSLL